MMMQQPQGMPPQGGPPDLMKAMMLHKLMQAGHKMAPHPAPAHQMTPGGMNPKAALAAMLMARLHAIGNGGQPPMGMAPMPGGGGYGQ